MKLMNSLALRHLKQNKKQALSALLAITLAVSMLVAISTFFFSVYDSTVKFAEANDLMDTVSTSLQGMMTVGVLLGIVIACAAVFVISNAFNIQAGERIKQFGILKSVGATEAQIKSTVTAEGNWLSLVGIPAGIGVGHLLCFIAMFVMKSAMGSDDSVEYVLSFNLIAVLIAVALGYVTVRLAGSLTAQKVSKQSIMEAIRQTDEIRIDRKKLNTPKWIGRLFGFEGVLASKQLKRNRRKFRVTVLSLVISIVMFLSAFTFGDMLIKTARGAYANTGANVVSEITGSDFAEFDAYTKMLKSHNFKEMHTVYTYGYTPEKRARGWYNIITLDDDDYNAFFKNAGVKQGANILLDRQIDGYKTPFDVTLEDLGNVSFSVTESTEFTDTYLNSQTMTSYPTMIIPRSEAQRLNLTVTAHYYIVVDNAAQFISEINSESDSFMFENVYHHNIGEYTRDLQRMYATMMMFVYCFIGMLALIGATSVLATINSNINLRKSEFATLQAVGMDIKKLHRMLNFESLFYGIRSLLYGLPIGIVLSYGMYLLSINTNMRMTPEEALEGFPFEIPYKGMLICVLAVFAINFVSMYFATSKIRRSNIAESMRELNC